MGRKPLRRPWLILPSIAREPSLVGGATVGIMFGRPDINDVGAVGIFSWKAVFVKVWAVSSKNLESMVIE